MNVRVLRLIAVAVLALGASEEPPAQERQPVVSPPFSSRHTLFQVSSLNGMQVEGRTNARAGVEYEAAVSVTVEQGMAVLHRVIVDRTHALYFGYDLVATPVDGESAARLHFAPLSGLTSFRDIRLDGLTAGQAGTLPADVSVRFGEPARVPVMPSGSGFSLVEDELRFSATPQ